MSKTVETMSKIEYEMPPNYHEKLAKLLKMIETQQFYKNEIKALQPWANVEVMRKLKANLDQSIEQFETALASEYKAYQKLKTNEADLEEASKQLIEKSKMLYVYVKHCLPDKLDEFRKSALVGLTPQEIEKFYEDVATLEATKLDEIIAEMKQRKSTA
jgi:hypothetical protein